MDKRLGIDGELYVCKGHATLLFDKIVDEAMADGLVCELPNCKLSGDVLVNKKDLKRSVK